MIRILKINHQPTTSTIEWITTQIAGYTDHRQRIAIRCLERLPNIERRDIKVQTFDGLNVIRSRSALYALLALDSTRLAGILTYYVPEKGMMERVDKIATDGVIPGVGAELIRQVAIGADEKNRGLYLFASPKSHGFYQKLGFTPVHEEEGDKLHQESIFMYLDPINTKRFARGELYPPKAQFTIDHYGGMLFSSIPGATI